MLLTTFFYLRFVKGKVLIIRNRKVAAYKKRKHGGIRMINVMNTTKKKAGAAILCGALALTLGTGTTTFAAEGATDSLLVKQENGVVSYSTDGGQNWSENAPANMQAIKVGEGNIKINNKLASEDGIITKVMAKSENGKTLYSTDDGKTWSETAPEGMLAFAMGEQGNIKFKMKDASEDGIKTKVMVKVENGVKLYSTDDGKTWSETAPEGMLAFAMGEQGNIKFKMKDASEDGIITKVMAKSESGKTLYSTDDGKTWSETAPEGMPALNKGEQGNIKFKMKDASEDGIKAKVMAKSENGKTLFSTDDGQTWSEQAPEGLTVIK
ncbi:glycoside hydrolase [Paenibacillus melissococcoides]|uniref:Glycoside hydrolase n=1 Tax=Paenibacillus melissococcoides TaxID=2912268 RepID=A0ABM9G5Y3_9BACL|nr:sialidase family protein [Paenibacillus melissococcoides]MEB9894075.1 sialidase family protein [Bacillus cereus]CAH8247220.1 glycoside hydrolase [Paenibacillus melissococcoides]CAH8717061.1 glycoside hydrolase [Paenibacillus melissococcoides]CAH8718049.1 glycoside hydrolase [Paenibacillus melissococcoides]